MHAVKKLIYVLVVLVALGAAACGSAQDTEAEPDVVLVPPTQAPAPPAAAPVASPAGEAAFSAASQQAAAGPALAPSGQETSPSRIDAPAPGGTLRRLWADPPTLDPHLTSDTTSAGIVVEVFSGLVALDVDLQLVPDIAESWTVENGTDYTFTLRPNVTFHNGKPVTAHDFKWSIERASAPKTASPVADTYLNDIIGAMEYIEGNADEITGVQVIDDLTLKISIDAPKAYFLAKLTYPTAYVLDRETVEAGGRNWWVSDPVGTGPFKLKEYRIGERIVLERFAEFYREDASAQVDTVFMNLAGGQPMAMYENDEIDITGVSLFDLDRILDPEEPLNRELVVAPPGFSISYVGFNTDEVVNGLENPLYDLKFRQALNHAVDKELIASEVLSELVRPAYGILPPGFPGYNPDVQGLTYDPDLAQRLLSESAYADADSRPRIVITVPGTGGTIGLDLEVILEMWRQNLGVEVEIQQVEWATYLEDLDRRKFQAFAGLGWQADYPDPQDFLDILFHTDSSINHNGYSNPEVDRLLEDARIEQDVAARVSLYHQAEQIIVNDAAWVPLWFTGDRYALIKPNVTGYRLTPMTVPRLAQVVLE